MSLDLSSLRADCNQLAQETWFKLERGGQGPTSFNETSLTDHNLFMLDMKHPNLNVHHFTQREEVRWGADWEWWIGSDDDGWLCLRIQAKRVSRHSYPELAHPGGDDNFQYDVLIDSCNPYASEFPLHVFYDGWPQGEFRSGTYWADPAAWLACPNSTRPDRADQCVHAEPRDYGCAVASSLAVKATHEARIPPNETLNRRVSLHLSNALPWSYLWGIADRRSPEAPGITRSGRATDWQSVITDCLRTLYTPGGHPRARGQHPVQSDSLRDTSEAELHFLRALTPDSDRRLRSDLPSWAQAVRRKNTEPGRLLEISDAPTRLVAVADFTPLGADNQQYRLARDPRRPTA